jgi:hypothetical protein
MKFYFPYDRLISRAMERIRSAFMRYAPKDTVFVNTPEADAIQCLHYIGQNPREDTCKMWGSIFETPTLPKTSKYILFLYLNNIFYPQFEADWKRLLENAVAIITTSPDLIPYNCNIIETAWGYEPSIFNDINVPKKYTVLATGYMADAEAIDAVFLACYKSMTSMVHVGGLLDPQWREPTYTRFQNISDQELRLLYNQSRYVSALRRDPSYEMPAVEGYACGCQPICFPHYATKKYFSDFAFFVPFLPRDELAQVLIEHFKKPVEVKPNPEILKRFYWQTTMTDVWKKVCEAK